MSEYFAVNNTTVFIKLYEDGGVIYNDYDGDTHKVDTNIGCLLIELQSQPQTKSAILKKLSVKNTFNIEDIDEIIAVLLSKNIIYCVE